MGKPTGFLEHGRQTPSRRPVPVRLLDWNEVYEDFDTAVLQKQASRCMDCGIPFCNSGCPLGNIIPDWNDLVYKGNWQAASNRLHATNNFPEFTGRLCPAPCEGACVLGINQDPVTIEQIEQTIAERAWEDGLITPILPSIATGKAVAVIGSGPAGLAAAQQLTRAGHRVVVFERADRIGGLLRYGIPEFKMQKSVLERRLEQMRSEGTEFRTGADVGGALPVAALREDFDAIVLAVGSTVSRDLPVPGREAQGIHFAMEYLPLGNRGAAGDYLPEESPIHAGGKRVVIIGGGDTGADCLGTAHRQGAASVHQFEIMPRPVDGRPDANPWPTFPLSYKVTSAHEEGGERVYCVNTEEFIADDEGNLTGLRFHEVRQVFTDGRMSFERVEGSDTVLEADLVFLAMGFTGPERSPLLEQLGLRYDPRGNIARDGGWAAEGAAGVFVAGDAGRGQSLIVWAIAEGRSAAAAVDTYLQGESDLPAPIKPTDRPLT